jgi:hypothetical protein
MNRQHEFRLHTMLHNAHACEARALRDVGEIARAIELAAIAKDHEQRAAKLEAEIRSIGEPIEPATRYLLGLREEEPGALAYCARGLVEQARENAIATQLRAAFTTAYSALDEAHRLAEGAER